MIRLSELVPDVLIYAPGAPGPLIRRELRKAAQRFCRSTLIVLADTPAFTVVAETKTLDLTEYCAPQTQPVKVIEVNIDGRVIPSVGQDTLRGISALYQQAQPGAVSRYYARDEKTVTLFPVPAADVPGVITMAVCPTDAANSLPDELGGLWRNAIVGGALARICVIPGQSYTSVDTANMGSSWYYEGERRARIEFNTSFGRGTKVTMRPFA